MFWLRPGYPTIKAFKKGSSKPDEYNSGRDYKSFKRYVEALTVMVWSVLCVGLPHLARCAVLGRQPFGTVRWLRCRMAEQCEFMNKTHQFNA